MDEQKTETAKFDYGVLWPIGLLLAQIFIWLNVGLVLRFSELVLPLLFGPLIGAIATAFAYRGRTKRAESVLAAARQTGDPDLILVEQNPATRRVAKAGLTLAIVIGSIAAAFALLVVVFFILLITSDQPWFQW